MRKIFKTLLLLIFISNLFSAQENDWKNIGNNHFQKVIKENSFETLKDKDSLTIEIHKYNSDEKVDFSDLAKLQTIPKKTSFENFKQKLKISTFNPKLKKNSEYILKSGFPENSSYNYVLSLNNSITKIQIETLIEYIKKNFQTEKIEFTSKEAAANEAAETIGVKSEDIFDRDIFPASIEIQSKTKINLKNLTKKYFGIIDDIDDNNTDVGILIMKVKT